MTGHDGDLAQRPIDPTSLAEGARGGAWALSVDDPEPAACITT
ncbi:MAG: hypothetical protein ACLPR9_13420 [Acidimicrobiales bacterium]